MKQIARFIFCGNLRQSSYKDDADFRKTFWNNIAFCHIAAAVVAGCV
jgi:hypothetical protein